ncbi:MAG: hypothetical protein H0X49_02280 [Acidobacteria bacterium]|jgi:uncharacterized membrane protein|nr:hypothetical protein [Acidobacteriota bacterium]
MAKKKFDTNPLDPTFPEKIKEAETVVLPKNRFKTSEFPPPSVTEEQTRRFDETNFNNYNSPYNGQNTPANYKTTNLADMNKSSSRKVAKIGLPENILTALPYLPFWIGLIAGLLMLLFVPKSEAKARFHAAQGLAAHIGIFIVSAILSGVGHATDLADMGNWIFTLVTTIMLIVFAIKAWRGKPVHIESVDDLTEWLEDKIKPRG